MKFSHFTCVAIALIGFTTFCYAHLNPSPKQTRLRPSAAITTLNDGTQVVNTTTLAKDVIGYQGHTPITLHIKDGRIIKIELLPHGETPRFFQRAAKHLNLKAYENKKLQEATDISIDAVSGATLSSQAIFENITRGLTHAINQQTPKRKKR